MIQDELQCYIKSRIDSQKERMNMLLHPSISHHGYDEFDVGYLSGEKIITVEQVKQLVRYYSMGHGSLQFMEEFLSSKGRVETKWLRKRQKNPLDVGYQEIDTFNEKEFRGLAYNPLDTWYCSMVLCVHFLSVGNLEHSLDFLMASIVAGNEINNTLRAKLSTYKIRQKVGANGSKARNASLDKVRNRALELYRDLLSRRSKISARSAASNIKSEVVSYGAGIGYKFTSEDPKLTIAKWINKAK